MIRDARLSASARPRPMKRAAVIHQPRSAHHPRGGSEARQSRDPRPPEKKGSRKLTDASKSFPFRSKSSCDLFSVIETRTVSFRAVTE